MVMVTLTVTMRQPLDRVPRTFGLSIDEPLKPDFITSQPEKVMGESYRSDLVELDLDLPVGEHRIYIGNNAESGLPWHVEIKIPDVVWGTAEVSKTYFLDIPFTIVEPVPVAPPVEKIPEELLREVPEARLLVEAVPEVVPEKPEIVVPAVELPALPWYVAWLKPVLDFGGALTESVVNFFSPLFEPLKDIPTKISDFSTSISKAISEPLSALGKGITDLPKSVVDNIIGNLSNAFKSATNEGIKTSIETVSGVAVGSPEWMNELNAPLTKITDNLVAQYKSALSVKSYEKSPITGEEAVNALEDMKNKLLSASVANFTMHVAVESGSLGQFEFMKDLDPLVISKFGMDSLIRAATMLPIEKAVLRQAEYEYNTRYVPEIPTYTDLINMVVKEVIPLNEFKTNMAKKGYSATWSQYIWDAHFIPPSLGDILTAWRRGTITEADVDKLMILVDLDPRFKTVFDTRKYIDPSLSLTRFMFETGAIGADEVTTYVHRQGYSPAHEKAITDFIVRFQERLWRRRYLVALSSAVTLGMYAPDRLKKEVLEAGYTEGVADWMLRTAEVRREITTYRFEHPKPKLLSVKDLEKAYLLDKITSDVLRTELLQRGYVYDEVDLKISLIDEDKVEAEEGRRVVALSIGQMLSAFRYGEMSEDELRIKLQLRGLSEGETTTLINTKKKQWEMVT